MAFLRSTVDYLRDRYAPVTHTSTFRTTGQLTPEEFLAAGDFLTYRFPSWSWAPASHPSRRVSYLPPDKQFLVTRGVPCHRRLGDALAGADTNETLIKDFLAGPDGGDDAGDDGGWLSTGGGDAGNVGDVRTLDQSGRVEDKDESADEDIPDMEDDEDDDEAIIRDKGRKSATRTYNIYITYTPYYRTPRLYLSGYASTSEPLPPRAMMDDIVGDYTDKTVTLEDFPFFDAASSVKMASIHPCKHASVMKVLLDRADAALKLRREKVRAGKEASAAGMEGLIDDTSKLAIGDKGHQAGVAAAGGNGGDEWEVLEGDNEEESAIRVDQYLVVFIKFVGSVTPTIEHDFTMGV